MNSVFTALSTPLNGQIFGLGPVQISAKYPPKPTSKGSMMRTLRATDASGQIDITLFGEAASLPFVDGSTITLKGSFKRGDYNGTPKLQGEKGITIEGQEGFQQPQVGQPPVSGAYNGPSGAPQSASAKDSMIVRQNALAHATALVVANGLGSDIFTQQGLVLQLAQVYAKFSETGEVPDVGLVDPDDNGPGF